MTLAELRAIAQDGKHADPTWYRVHRHLSIHITRVAMALGLTADQVSLGMMGATLAAALCLASPSGWVNVAGFVLGYAGFLLDKVDGEVARLRGRSTMRGILLDRLHHRLIEPALLLAVAWHEFHFTASWLVLVAGFAAAWLGSVIDENQHLAPVILLKHLRQGGEPPAASGLVRAGASAPDALARLHRALRPLKAARTVALSLPIAAVTYALERLVARPVPTWWLELGALALGAFLLVQVAWYWREGLELEAGEAADLLHRSLIKAPGEARASRRRIVSSLLAAAVLSALSARHAAADADTVYVDIANASCSPAAAGTAAEPFCSITGAINAWHAPGTVILVRPGTYREQVTVPASGLPDQPITLLAAPEEGHPVVIDGADDYGKEGLWTPAGDSAWLARSVTWIPHQVRAHGARLTPWTGVVDALPTNSWKYVLGLGLYVNVGADPATQDVRVGRRRYGIYLPNREYVRVEGFTILEPDDRGIQLNAGSNHVEIVGNVVRWANEIGIQAVGTSTSRIAGNDVSECNNHGISLTSGSTGCVVELNESSYNVDPAQRRANGLYLFDCPANVVRANRWHHNQDSGEQIGSGSNDVLSIQNVSWANGDHGFDHLHATGSVTVGDVAYGNYKDGFSFEGNSSGCTLHDCIAIENGLTTNEADLWVDDDSMLGFDSDDNIFWNSTDQPPIKRGVSRFGSVSSWTDTTGRDLRSLQLDPFFVDPVNGDFHLKEGSPAIDAANSGVPQWPPSDASGAARADDPGTPDTGTGFLSYADRGAYEYQPPVTTAVGDPRPRREGELSIRPNPMSSAAELEFGTLRGGPLTVAVYDLGGRCVRTLRAGAIAAPGAQRMTLDARGDDGRRLGAGVYFVRVQGPDGERSRRLLLLH